MGRPGIHNPGIKDTLWRKIAEMEGLNPANVKLVSDAIREMLTVIAFNPKAWRDFVVSLNGQQQPAPVDQRELYPPLPPVPQPQSAPTYPPPIPPDADPWAPQLPPQPAPQPIAMYVPPRGEDIGGFFTIQHAPVPCSSCPPYAMIGIGQEVYVRTNPQGIKEYRHPWHVPNRRW